MKEHEDSAPTNDITKSLPYAIIDLGAKIFSAVALVALGVAGWLFQNHVETAQRSQDKHDREERKYLPGLRAIAELQVVLVTASMSLSNREYTAAGSLKLERAGTCLAYMANSLYFLDGEPSVTITSAGQYGSITPHLNNVSTSLRSASLLLAEFMRLMPRLQTHIKNKRSLTVSFFPKYHELYLSQTVGMKLPGDEYAIIDPRSEPAWVIWFPENGMKADEMYALALQQLADELLVQTVSVTDSILRDHPDISDKYVTIHSEVIKDRERLVSCQ
jgi:hypothetical protein